MGAVYRGYHEVFKMDVAIKFLHAHLRELGNGGQRFVREGQLAVRLTHQSIVRVLDAGELDGHFFLVMEYVDGQNLLSLIREAGSLSVIRALEITQQLAQGLAYAHGQSGLIHRDVKPDNVLVAHDGTVKLADFGLAKVIAAEQPSLHCTVSGSALGTPSYMPPEQFTNARDVDHRADIFALGATLYHMLAGKVPFDGASFLEVQRKVEQTDPDPLPSHVPAYVVSLVERMMEKEAENRHPTYDALLEQLDAAREQLVGTVHMSGEHTDTPAGSSLASQSIVPGPRILRPANPAENRVLLIVDIQNDFCPGGALAVAQGDEVVPMINKLSRRFSHVIMTQDWHREDHLSFASSHPGKRPLDRVELSYGPQILWPDHCIQDTPGAMFHPELQVSNVELVIRKGYLREIDSYSAFFENDRRTPTGLAGYLRERGLNRIFLVGLATDFCVAYTALDACRLGFEVTVIEEACRGIDVDGSLDAAWQQMTDAGATRA